MARGASASAPSRVLVPIRSIGPAELPRVLRHLLALSADDRYLRFGYVASDDQIARYAQSLDFARDEIFGIYNRGLHLIALAHLAFAAEDEFGAFAEFGVSVAEHARARGYGSRLFERAVLSARNKGVHMIFIHALSENVAMLKIARSAGASVVRSGGESEAHLELPPASFDSRFSVIKGDGYANFDYQLKQSAKRFWSLLAALMARRRSVKPLH
ncbi:MAG: GNAT family N-acetyltransferase [Variovorax sp.]